MSIKKPTAKERTVPIPGVDVGEQQNRTAPIVELNGPVVEMAADVHPPHVLHYAIRRGRDSLCGVRTHTDWDRLNGLKTGADERPPGRPHALAPAHPEAARPWRSPARARVAPRRGRRLAWHPDRLRAGGAASHRGSSWRALQLLPGARAHPLDVRRALAASQ